MCQTLRIWGHRGKRFLDCNDTCLVFTCICTHNRDTDILTESFHLTQIQTGPSWICFYSFQNSVYNSSSHLPEKKQTMMQYTDSSNKLLHYIWSCWVNLYVTLLCLLSNFIDYFIISDWLHNQMCIICVLVYVVLVAWWIIDNYRRRGERGDKVL